MKLACTTIRCLHVRLAFCRELQISWVTAGATIIPHIGCYLSSLTKKERALADQQKNDKRVTDTVKCTVLKLKNDIIVARERLEPLKKKIAALQTLAKDDDEIDILMNKHRLDLSANKQFIKEASEAVNKLESCPSLPILDSAQQLRIPSVSFRGRAKASKRAMSMQRLASAENHKPNPIPALLPWSK